MKDPDYTDIHVSIYVQILIQFNINVKIQILRKPVKLLSQDLDLPLQLFLFLWCLNFNVFLCVFFLFLAFIRTWKMQCSRIALTLSVSLHLSVSQVLDWVEQHGEVFLNKHSGVGKSLHRARALQKRHDDFQQVAQVTHLDLDQLNLTDWPGLGSVFFKTKTTDHFSNEIFTSGASMNPLTVHLLFVNDV